VKEVAASPAGVGAGDRGPHLASPGRRGPQGRWRPRSIYLASPDPSYSDASPSLALPCSHRDLRRGQGAPLRVPKSRRRGRTACCGPGHRGRRRWGARRRRRGRCSSLDMPRADCGEVEERERESGAGRAASGGWDAASPGMRMPGASLYFAAGVATPAGAATVRPTSAKCMQHQLEHPLETV
jgi:hypothetical protein